LLTHSRLNPLHRHITKLTFILKPST